MRTSYVVCLSTVAKIKDAQRLARELVSKKYAACVTILPGATSVYVWKKHLHRDKEFVLLMKTKKSRVPALQKALLPIHPYECPEFIVLPIVAGSSAYLRWIEDSV
jgi:periplasmic divalent cation tolerance protein